MSKAKNIPVFYTVKEVAEILKVSKMSITRYIRAGRIKALQLCGVYRITEEELMRILGDGIPAAAPPTKSRKKNAKKRSSRPTT